MCQQIAIMESGSRAETVNLSICDKCKRPVEQKNDALLFALKLNEKLGQAAPAFVLLFTRSRHLLPVTDESGAVICPGSPSRAQYLPGQPRDTRGEFDYKEEMEPFFRAAYAQLLADAEK